MIKAVLATALILFLMISIVAASGLADGEHDHAVFETEVSGTNAVQSTEIAVLQQTRIIPTSGTIDIEFPSQTPTLATTRIIPTSFGTSIYPTQGTPPPPTQENIMTPSQTSAPTHTRTPSPTPTTGNVPPYLEPGYTCRVRLTSNLTRRETPSPGAGSLGILNADTVVTIYPYDGSVPFSSTDLSWWYVRVAAVNGVPSEGWLAFARVRQTAPLVYEIIDSFMEPVDFPCAPVLLRS